MKFTTTLFGQVLQIIPQHSFMRLVHKCSAQRHAKGFSSLDQYVSMLFCQLAQCKSLREISDGLAITCGKLSHLGLHTAPARSMLSYANAYRPGSFIGMVSFICLTCLVARALIRKSSSASRIGCSASIPPQSTVVSAFFPGLNSAKQKAPLTSIFSWTMMVIYRTTDGKGAGVIIARHFRLSYGSIIAVNRGYRDFGCHSHGCPLWKNSMCFRILLCYPFT